MKYNINKEFFPFSLFRPPISEAFLRIAVPHMKPPRRIFRDKTVDISRHAVSVGGGEQIECFLFSPKGIGENAPTTLAALSARIAFMGHCFQQEEQKK